MVKFLLSIIVAVLLLGGLYLFIKSDRAFAVIFPKDFTGGVLQEKVNDVRHAIIKTVDPFITPVIDKGEELLNDAKNVLQSQAEDTVDKAKVGTLKIIGEAIGVREKPSSGGNPSLLASVISVHAPEALAVVEASLQKGGNELPTTLAREQGKDGIFLMKNAADESGKTSFTVLWKEASTAVADVGSTLTKTMDRIFSNDGEYRMSIPITKNGITKKYTVYIVVEE